MRKVTVALLAGAYLCVGLTAALLLWRDGAGWGAAVAALIGSLGLTLGLHGLFDRLVTVGALRGELSALRDGHLILADQMQDLHDQVETLTTSLQRERLQHTEEAQRSEDLSGEVRMLEDMVQRLSDSLEHRLASAERAQPGRGGGGGPARRQESALLETVREALADNRVDLYLQPVVSLPQRRTMYYESFSRLRDASGRVMMPGEYLDVAEPGGLMSAIDNLVLFRCVQIVRRLAKNDRKVGIFCNISLGSLGDETFFPQFQEFLSQNRDMAGALIFELGQPAFDARGSTEARNMAKLADLGCRFSLDKVEYLDLDFHDLARSDVKFVKVTADVLLRELLEGADGPARDVAADDFAEVARRHGLEIIAEKVESERQVVDILELNIGFGQGHLFGEPRAIRESVLAEAEPPADMMRGAMRGPLRGRVGR